MSTTSITLTEDQIDELGAELDAIRQRVVDDLGQADRDYLYKVVKWQRGLEVGGRASLYLGFLPPFWLMGTAALSRVEDPRQHGDRPQRHARPVRLDA